MAEPKVYIRRSSVPGKIPTTAQLAAGELAVNTYDGKVYLEQDQGAVGVGTTVIVVNPWGVGLGSATYNTYFTAGKVGIGITNPLVELQVSSGPVVVGSTTTTGTASQNLQVTGGAYFSGSVGIGTTFSSEPGITVLNKVQILQQSDSTSRLIFRAKPENAYRWNIDNDSANNFRIFSEDDATAANGTVRLSISTTGTVSAAKFSGDGSLLTGITASGSGVAVQNQGSTVGTAGTLNFSTNLTASFASGTATISLSNNPSISGILTADQIYTSNNNNGTNIRIGDDLWIGDINLANTTRFSGAQDSTKAFVIFGSSDTVALGRTGTGPLYYGGDFTIAGIMTANKFIGDGSLLTNLPIAISTNTTNTNQLIPYVTSYGSTTGFGATSSFVFNPSTGNLGIGTTNPTSNLQVVGNALVSGVVTATSFAKSSGTSSQFLKADGSVDSSTYLTSESDTFYTVTNRGNTSATGINVSGDLYVSGNISFGGTTTQLNLQQLEIVDADIVLGIGTSFSPTDNTANHGGIAIASTEGSPLVSLKITPGETNPDTYKKIMWFKNNATGLGTDAWLANYAVGIGSTQFPTGTRLAVGNVQFTQNDLEVVRNINSSGVVTASSFVGNLTGTAVTVTTLNVGIKTITTVTDITAADYQGKSKSVTTDDGTPQAVYVGAAGTAMFIVGSTNDRVIQYTLSTPYDVSTAGAAVTFFSNATQETTATGIDFNTTGTKMFLSGNTGVSPLIVGGDYIHEYSLSTAWNVAPSSVGWTTSYNVTQDSDPQAVAFGSSGSKMYVVGNTNNAIYQYSLSTPYSLASGVTYDSKSLAVGTLVGETNPTDISFNTTGTVLWVIGSANDRIYEFRLGTAWDISTAVFYDDVFVGFNETSPTAVHIIPDQNVAYIVGTTNDTVYQYALNSPALQMSASGINTASSIILNNETRIKDKLYVKGNTIIDGTLITQGTSSIEGNLTVSGGTISVANVAATLLGANTTTNITLANAQTTGTLTVGGSAQTGAITLGLSTASQTTNIQSGISTSGTQKTINIGTGGASGSNTLITLGSATAGAISTVTIPSPTDLKISGGLYDRNNSVGTAGSVLTSTGAGVSWTSGGMKLIDTQTFSNAGISTWSKPAGSSFVIVYAIGGGGGGASGGASNNVAFGGAGGGSAGAVVRMLIPTVLLGDTETVTVGSAGTGGASVSFTYTGSNGSVASNPGIGGGDSSFGFWVKAEGGNGGTINASNAAVGGGGAAIGVAAGFSVPVESGGDGGNGAATDNNPVATATPSTINMSAGGGSGGPASAVGTGVNGVAGGTAGIQTGGSAGTGSGTAGVSGTAGGVGTTVANGLQASGGGGGGNGCSASGSSTAGAGGNGAAPGSGGGGGGSARVANVNGNVATAGKGGDGGVGRVIVYSYG